MEDYKFAQRNTILYMYEPLWCLEKQEARKIYERLFSKLHSTFNNSDCALYIVYIDGIFKSHMLFAKYNFQLIDKKI